MTYCFICADNVNSMVKLVHCKHEMCISCLLKLNKLKCPFCRDLLYDQLPVEVLAIITKNFRISDTN